MSQVLRMTLEQQIAYRPMQTFVTSKLISMPYIIGQMKTIIMEFHNTTFACLRYGCNNGLKACTSYTAKSVECITEVDHAKVLGVTLSRNDYFKEHIQHILCTANQLCGWVLRTFNTRKTLPMMTLWNTLIRCRLDYCCQLWSPSKKGDVQALEQMQDNIYVISLEYSTSLTGSSLSIFLSIPLIGDERDT